MPNEDIKKLFHSIANELNKVSVKAGAATKLANLKNDRGMNETELKAEFTKLLEILSDIEKFTLNAGHELQKLKDVVRAELHIDLKKDD